VPTRVLLEGPAIEPLLAQVREEYGSGVRIISADKVRSGGFGGFFAKQHYELSVEVPDPTQDRDDGAYRKPKAAPVLAAAGATGAGGTATSDGRAGATGAGGTVSRSAAPQTLEQLLERAESEDRIAPADEEPTGRSGGREAGIGDTDAAARRRALTDPGAAFADLMAGLDRAEGIASDVRPRTESQTVRPFRPAQATGQPVNGNPGVKPLPHVPTLAELMGGLGMSDQEVAAIDQALSRTAPAGPARSPAEAYGVTPGTAVAPASTAPARPLVAMPTSARPVDNDAVVLNLISVGMPEPMAAEITGADTYAGVLSVLAHRPAAPGIPEAPGEILVLAGDLAQIVPIGKQLLQQINLDSTHLLLAGPTAAGTGIHSSKVMHTAEQAAARAEKLQSADSAWIVALDAPVGATDPIWVNEICDALGATALWAVVDATRKTADTARHLRTLGDVEALVVHNVELTADPATVLGLDLPIFSLDGRPATPHAWAAMLCARIAADVAPMAAPPRRAPRGR
jgi:hypothetical protein